MEVDSNDPTTGHDTTKDFCSIQRNDVLTVQAVLNEIDGLDRDRSSPGEPSGRGRLGFGNEGGYGSCTPVPVIETGTGLVVSRCDMAIPLAESFVA